MSNLWLKLKNKLQSVWNNSQTKLWAYLQVVPGILALATGYVSQYLTDPTIQNYISMLNPSKTVSTLLVLTGIVTYVAHGHKDA